MSSRVQVKKKNDYQGIKAMSLQKITGEFEQKLVLIPVKFSQWKTQFLIKDLVWT